MYIEGVWQSGGWGGTKWAGLFPGDPRCSHGKTKLREEGPLGGVPFRSDPQTELTHDTYLLLLTLQEGFTPTGVPTHGPGGEEGGGEGNMGLLEQLSYREHKCLASIQASL